MSKPLRPLPVAVAAASAALLAACGSEPPPAPAPRPSADAPRDDDAAPAEKPRKEAEVDQDDLDLDDLPDADDEPAAPSIEAACGGLSFDKPDQEVVNARLAGLPVVQTGRRQIFAGLGTNYTVTITGSLSLKATLQSATTTAAFNVTAEPRLAQSAAEQEVARRAGTTTTEFVPVKDRASLADRASDWAGIVCTVQPGVRLTSLVGGGRGLVTFDPPLPAGVSPKADPSRYDEELPTERTWVGILATVVQSDASEAPTGSTHVGTAKLRKIDPVVTTTGAGGAPVTITADLAYELALDFGSPAITTALGLRPKTRFYIDHASRSYRAIVAEGADATTPTATFVAP